jgi:hypothetical protein
VASAPAARAAGPRRSVTVIPLDPLAGERAEPPVLAGARRTLEHLNPSLSQEWPPQRDERSHARLGDPGVLHNGLVLSHQRHGDLAARPRDPRALSG